MKAEPKDIEQFARFLCERAGRDPDRLRAGNVAYHSSFDQHSFAHGDYDELFDAGGEYAPDGRLPNTDPGMFTWRDYVEEALAIRSFLGLTVPDSTPAPSPG